jgi:DNA repair exonuclease SbcCD ATPase subunit
LEELNEEIDGIPNCNQEDAEYILSLQGALLHSVEKPPGLSKKTKRISVLLSVTGAIGFLGGVIWGAVSGFSTLPIVVINIGALTALLGLFWVLLSRRMASTPGEKRSLPNELEKALRKVGYKNYDDFDKDLYLRKGIEGKISAKRSYLLGLTGGKELGEFEKIMHTDQLRLDYLYKQKEKLLPYALKRDIDSAEFAEGLLGLEKEVSELQAEFTGIKEELLTIEGSLASIDADPEQLTGLEEEKERLLEWQEFYKHRKKVLDRVEELLGIAYQQTLANAVPTIRKELETYISTITAGRYSEVELDANSLTLSAKAPETGEMVNIEELSTATQDQFYLVARLGLVRHLTGGVRPPLILDDITVNFDDQRRQATKKILTELSKDYQILLFTCHDFHDDWGRLIELEG